MKKISIAGLVLSSLATLFLTACQQPAAPVKDGVCSQPQTSASFPQVIDPDCPAAAPGK